MANNKVASDIIWRMTYRRLASRLPEEVMREWFDGLDLLELSEGKAVIGYRSGAPMKGFPEQYKALLSESLSWASGQSLELEFSPVREAAATVIPALRSKQGKKKKSSKSKWGLMKFCAGILMVIVFLGIIIIGKSALENQTFHETFYQVASVKAPDSVRIIQLSDLHNTEYGENNERLVERLIALKPDLIVMTGDMVDRREESADIAIELCRRAVQIAPTYYIYGNNETAKAFGVKDMTLESVDGLLECTEDTRDSSKFYDLDDDLRIMLEGAGVQVLFNSQAQVQIGETVIDLFGVVTSSPGAFWEYAGEAFSQYLTQNTDHFKLFLCHEPTIFEMYSSEHWGDLALCGHTHGGVAQIPYLGGLYVNSKGEHVLFPNMRNDIYDYYVAGMYELNGSPMIVNTGLTNKGVVRVNNQPEMVIVDINRY